MFWCSSLSRTHRFEGPFPKRGRWRTDIETKRQCRESILWSFEKKVGDLRSYWFWIRGCRDISLLYERETGRESSPRKVCLMPLYLTKRSNFSRTGAEKFRWPPEIASVRLGLKWYFSSSAECYLGTGSHDMFSRDGCWAALPQGSALCG
jgi:hypothetical protein